MVSPFVEIDMDSAIVETEMDSANEETEVDPLKVEVEVIDLSSDTDSGDDSSYGVTDDELSDDDIDESSGSNFVPPAIKRVPGGLDPKEYKILKRRFDLKEFSIVVTRLRSPGPGYQDSSLPIDSVRVTKKRKRRKKSEPSKYIHECSFKGCKFKFDSEECRDAHYKRKHEGIKKPYKCSICGSCFPFPSHLTNHQKTHDSTTISRECHECSENFVSSWALQKHLASVHKIGGHAKLCEHCGKTLSGKSGYRKHIRLHLPHLAIPCEICGKRFTTRRDANRHLITHDPESRKQLKENYKCQYCSKLFSSKSYLLLHERMHTGQLELSCDICGYKAATQSTLKVHMLSHSEIREMSCDICSYTCKTLARLNDHKRTVHSESRNFLCTYCGMAFKNKNNWVGHEEIHKNNDNAISCTICGRGFKVRRYLISHFRHAHKFYGKVPDDISQITSETVAESVNSEETVSREESKKVESDLRKYVCSFCGKAFKYKNNWASHELLHTNGDETFTCTLCGRGFKMRRYLTYHLRKAHRIIGKIPKSDTELNDLARELHSERTTYANSNMDY